MRQTKKQRNRSTVKTWLAVAVLAAIAVIAFLILNPLTGNPVSELLVKQRAKAYLAAYDSALDLQLTRTGYNFKDGCYYAHVASSQNADIHFTLMANGWGKLLSDDYEDKVTSGWNTAMRLDEEYRTLVDAVIEADSFPYVCDIYYGELLFADFSQPAGAAGCLQMADLVLGQAYDIPSLAVDYGKLTIYVDSDTVTVEEASRILLMLKSRMDSGGVPFRLIDFTLQHPRMEDGARPGEPVMVLNFPYADIAEAGMPARVQSAYEAALAYYREQDAMRTDEAMMGQIEPAVE